MGDTLNTARACGPSRARRASPLLAAVLAAGWGCGRDLPPGPRDTRPPLARIVYPPPDSAGLYDRDSNGLVDLEIAWSDSGGRVNPASARITCAPACVPGLPADTNLATAWRVVRRDSAGLALEEVVGLLLREGAQTLTITVADTAGNVSASATVHLTLPPGAFHQSISLAGRPDCQPERGVNLALSPDGQKGFAPYHGCVAVFDPDGVQPTRFISNVPNVGWASQISVDTATGLAYVAGGGTPTAGFTVLDTRTEQVVADHNTSSDIASVAVDGDHVYAGESCTDGALLVFDKRTLSELGRVAVGAVQYNGCPNAESFVFSSDHSIGWATIVGAGLIRFDAEARRLLDYFDLEPSYPGYLGDSREVALAGGGLIYIARIGEGLDLYQTNPWYRLAHLPAQCCFVAIAVAPDQHAVVANLSDAGNPQNGDVPIDRLQLYEVGADLTLRYSYPPRLGRITDAVRFHPDGRRFYVMAEYQVDVYLVRPL